MNTYNFSLGEVKQLDMVDYLEKSGHLPKKISGNDYWYLSPLRTEKEASFKVNRKLNAWYDHGLGQGGNLIDFGIRYHNCSVKELVQKINQNDFSFHRQTSPVINGQGEDEERKIKILDTRPISNTALLFYLKERRVPLDVAMEYCKEVNYELYGKRYFAIGFENNSGGYELRNRYFKGSSSPKDATLIRKEGAEGLTVMEGFFSFLSWLTINRNQPQLPTDYLVLNSLSFLEKNVDRMQSYPKANLMLDNDTAGDKATLKLLQISSAFKDNRELYHGHKDLNHWLTELGRAIQRQQQSETKISFSNQKHRTGRGIC
ncbi:MAG: toprim domain-containing protein [Ferruginibacter sp.]